MLKKHRVKLIVAGVLLLLLAAAFFLADGRPSEPSPTAPVQQTAQISDDTSEEVKSDPIQEPPEESVPKTDTPENKEPEKKPVENPSSEITSPSEEQPEQQPPVEEKPTQETPSEPETPPAVEPDPDPETFTVTLSVRCDTILQNKDKLKPEKLSLVPENGVIFAAKEVTANRGESVFHLLQREMKRAKIHMEFENTPLYQSAYIEGIGNLYEYDCGEQSGWMYRVNGAFPGYGCSKYQLKAGDVVEWVYTCDLGRDVGGEWAAGKN